MSKIKNSGRIGIRRHNYDGVGGWFVRYMRDGAIFRKVFSDKEFGSELASYDAARRFHSQLLTYFPPRTIREHSLQRKVNSLEIIGVSRITKISKGHPYVFWHASWTDPVSKKARNKSFSVNKHGEEEAKRLAIETRRIHVEEYGEAFFNDYDEDLVWLISEDDIAIGANIDKEASDSEGAILLKEHRVYERSRELRQLKIKDYLCHNKKLNCELCGFIFETYYGSLGAGLIEIHHLNALSNISRPCETCLSDLILVCSNCHYVIHRDVNYQRNFRQLKEVLSLREHMK